MKMSAKIATGLSLLAVGAGVALAPAASADPLVPFGAGPAVPVQGNHVQNQDETNTTNGFVDIPF